MRNTGFIFLAVALVFSISACKKKQPTLEQMQEPLSMQELSNVGSQAQSAAPQMGQDETAAGAITPAPDLSSSMAGTDSVPQLEGLPPSGPFKPSAVEIQTALKNAGYYTGEIDGKVGPMTKKAIEEFQKANGLNPDGVVGPKTWQVLSGNLDPVTETPAKKGVKR